MARTAVQRVFDHDRPSRFLIVEDRDDEGPRLDVVLTNSTAAEFADADRVAVTVPAVQVPQAIRERM